MLRAVDRTLAVISVIAAGLVLVLLFAGPSLIGAKKSGTFGYGTSPASGSSSSGPPSSAVGSGAAVFVSAGCGSCHTLKAAKATGTVGPNLDQVRPSASTVKGFVQSGAGVMPSFVGKLTPVQIALVAGYVARVAGR